MQWDLIGYPIIRYNLWWKKDDLEQTQQEAALYWADWKQCIFFFGCNYALLLFTVASMLFMYFCYNQKEKESAGYEY